MAYRWLLDSRVPASSIALVGNPAGGLALAATLAVRDQGYRYPMPLLCISLWVDLAVSGESMGTNAVHDPIVSRAMLLG
jgi:acetyl esterase/lipase